MTENGNIIEIATPEETATLTVQTTQPAQLSVSERYNGFYKLAKTLSTSEFVPQTYQGNVANTLIALDMADRMQVTPLAVMQNLYVVKGKPSWSGQFCMAIIRKIYKNVKPVYVGTKGSDDWGCYISAEDESGEKLQGATVTIAMVKGEGWYSKKDKYGNETSKWQTMPELMLAYRAAAFFARVNCPELLMGCAVEGEAEDIEKASVNKTKGDIL